MSRIQVNKADKYRVLLTEVLPYEVPIIFSNDGLYKFISQNPKLAWTGRVSTGKDVLSNLLKKKDNGYTIPFDYKINKGLDSYRHLSIVHPSSQIDFIDFYNNYDHQILNLCDDDRVSLRRPSKISSHYYEKGRGFYNKDIKDGSVEQEGTGFDEQPKFASSYFSYSRFNFEYKFFDSDDFYKLEKQYPRLMFFDISKCFSSIYTHTISWAVKNKKYAKKYANQHSFDTVFDKLMQKGNYNETNGIVIGPEFSRIFAEVILQKIDQKVIGMALDKRKLLHGKDYSIRRYVDDYFLFTDEEKIQKYIFSLYQEELEKYKLFINESKTKYFQRPFITNISIAKMDIYDVMQEIFSLSTEEIDKRYYAKPIKGAATRSRRFINRIKSIIKLKDIGFHHVSTFVIANLQRKVIRVISNELKLEEKEENLKPKSISSFLLFYTEMMFYFYAMDVRVRSTYLISQYVVFINKVLFNWNDCEDLIRKKIYDEIIHIINHQINIKKYFSPEIQNLLICLRELGDEYLIASDKLVSMLSIDLSNSNKKDKVNVNDLDYFQISTLLYYIRDYSAYAVLRGALEKAILYKLDNNDDFIDSSELTCLVLDSISCPYIESGVKSKISRMVVKAAGGGEGNSKPKEFLSLLSGKTWFINWDSYIDLGYELYKKELKAPYE